MNQEECKKKIAGKGDNVYKLHLYSPPFFFGFKVKNENHNFTPHKPTICLPQIFSV